MIKHIFFVGLGGAIGSILRYLISIYVMKNYSGNFPFSTFIINISGCILIGLFIGLAERYEIINLDMRLFLITGFCGGYTTFSTFSAENLELFRNGNQLIMLSYVFLSLLLGFIGVWIGSLLSKI